MARIRVSHRADALEKKLEMRIRQGEYPRDHRLPTERELSEELGYSRGTIRKAFQALHQKGLVRYQKRSFWVAEDFTELELKFSESDSAKYAIFFHPDDYDATLLLHLEKKIREQGSVSLPFNLESLDHQHGNLDFMDYLHVQLAGAFFISSTYGQHQSPIEKEMLQTLPVPYLFLGSEPFFETNRYMGLSWKEVATQLDQAMSTLSFQHLQLIYPWPLTHTCLKSLEFFSKKLNTGMSKSIRWTIHYLDAQTSTDSITHLPGDFLIWFAKPPQSWPIDEKSHQMIVDIEQREGFHALHSSSATLAKVGLEWLAKSIQYTLKGHKIPDVQALSPKLSLLI